MSELEKLLRETTNCQVEYFNPKARTFSRLFWIDDDWEVNCQSEIVYYGPSLTEAIKALKGQE